MVVPHYYIDTSSVLDLEECGLIKRLRKVKIVIARGAFNEIRDRNLKRRLAGIATDRGPRKRAVFMPNLYSLDYGEKAIITAMACDQRRRNRRRIYVSNDAAALEFVGVGPDRICEGRMDTSEFIISLYKDNIVKMEDVHNVLLCSSRPPNKECRERLERLVAGDNAVPAF